MGFEILLGNRRLKDNLTAAVSRGRISHFYLISGPAGSGKKTLARALAAAILCKSANAPCGQCTACRKVFADTHPDLITVRDPEHKNLPVKMVREIRDDMFIRPNEADRKIYLFAQDMGIEGQNALLKVLEEPPAYGVFMLLTDNPEKLLPTVRSRCTELALQALPRQLLLSTLADRFPEADQQNLEAAADRSGGWLGQALMLLEEGAEASPQTQRFVYALAHRDTMTLLETLVGMEKWKRDQLLLELGRWADLLQQALTCRSGMAALSPLARELGAERSSQELLQALRCVQKAIVYIQGNVSPAAACGWLAWALR